MTDQPEKLDLNSLDLSTEKRQKLFDIFPEARTEDGKIDFDHLKLALGEVVDVGKERYGMNGLVKRTASAQFRRPAQVRCCLVPKRVSTSTQPRI